MLLKRCITILSLCYADCSTAQILSQFDWNSNPVTTAVVGPNAISVGGSATSSSGGVGGTNGLNPGAPTANDINLHIPNTGNIFDGANVDISIDYRRNESTAQMIKRANFTFNMSGAIGSFRVVYRVNNGAGFTTITSAAVAIPQDATFRNYRFTYDNCTGVGTMYINNVSVWTDPAPVANQNLYWVGEGDVVIGQDMDGANNNIPNLDNFIWQPYTCTVLPIELSSFSGINEGRRNFLKWVTFSEKNNNFFTIEHSTDGLVWKDMMTIYGAGTSTSSKTYSAYDEVPEKTVNYYRLRQTDFDGHEKRFSIIAIDNSELTAPTPVKVTDLLGREVDENYNGIKFIRYSDGSGIRKAGE